MAKDFLFFPQTWHKEIFLCVSEMVLYVSLSPSLRVDSQIVGNNPLRSSSDIKHLTFLPTESIAGRLGTLLESDVSVTQFGSLHYLNEKRFLIFTGRKSF